MADKNKGVNLNHIIVKDNSHEWCDGYMCNANKFTYLAQHTKRECPCSMYWEELEHIDGSIIPYMYSTCAKCEEVVPHILLKNSCNRCLKCNTVYFSQNTKRDVKK